VSEFWAPFLTGLIFVVPLIVLFYFLEKAPAPDALDIEERVERVSMSKEDRAAVFNQYKGGLITIAIGYGLLTIIRDVRDNYMGNMWRELGFADSASIFTTSETRITLVVLGVMALLILIVFVRIDRRRKIPATVLLRALGYNAEEMLEKFTAKGVTLDALPDARKFCRWVLGEYTLPKAWVNDDDAAE
jgi:hypothetical protein